VTNFASARQRMVEKQLRQRGIEDERVLAAMEEVPREEFLPEALRGRAYEDSALPIGGKQSISQPWIVAAICQALELEGSELVLEVGTGSGYSAAVLARLAAHVVSAERLEPLSRSAGGVLDSLGIRNVEPSTPAPRQRHPAWSSSWPTVGVWWFRSPGARRTCSWSCVAGASASKPRASVLVGSCR
jgi:protein-L-isoaspartate(D-aspartate) O-methyltransferase